MWRAMPARWGGRCLQTRYLGQRHAASEDTRAESIRTTDRREEEGVSPPRACIAPQLASCKALEFELEPYNLNKPRGVRPTPHLPTQLWCSPLLWCGALAGAKLGPPGARGKP